MTRYIIAFLLITTFAHAQTFQTAFSPRQGATGLVVSTINGSKHSIHLLAYSFTSWPILTALQNAQKRGVEVKIVVDKSQKLSKAVLAALKSGMALSINSNYKIMHNKMIVTDGHNILTGSFNFTEAAETRNAENVLVVNDAPKAVVDAYEAQFQKLWKEANTKEVGE